MRERLFEEMHLGTYRLSGEKLAPYPIRGRNPAFPGASLDTGFRQYDMESGT